MNSLIEIKRSMQAIWALPFSKRLRRALCWEYLSAFILGRADEATGIVPLAGMQVRYCTAGALRFLFHEIFMRQCYHFTADRDDPLILDCGSNIGLSVIYFKCLYPNSIITAFEPQSVAFQCLQENIDRNLLKDVKAHQVAVGNRCGKVPFYTDDAHPGSLLASQIQERMSNCCHLVEAAKLSDYVSGTVDLLKLDVEGAEFDVLLDLTESGKIHLIKQIILEYHHHIVRSEDKLASFLEKLELAGFGYQIEGKVRRPFQARHFQDLCIYAYRKADSAYG